MNATFSEKARQREGFNLLQQATQCLEEIVGTSADLVSAEWDLGEDEHGRLLYTLRLFDWSGAVIAVFDPEELKLRSHLFLRLNRLWADLLQVRSHRQLQELVGPAAFEER